MVSRLAPPLGARRAELDTLIVGAAGRDGLFSKGLRGNFMNNPPDNRTILLVEDEPLHLALYISALKKLTKATVVTAENEEHAMKLLKSNTPRLILLDLVIPAGGAAGGREYSFHEPVGFEVLRSVKANPRTAHIPVVVLSNLDSDEHRQRAHELGAEDYIVKATLQPRELVDRIARYLGEETLAVE